MAPPSLRPLIHHLAHLRGGAASVPLNDLQRDMRSYLTANDADGLRQLRSEYARQLCTPGISEEAAAVQADSRLVEIVLSTDAENNFHDWLGNAQGLVSPSMPPLNADTASHAMLEFYCESTGYKRSIVTCRKL